jgi:hypothetical protein
MGTLASNAAQAHRSGNAQIELRFKESLKSALSLITFGRFDRQLSIHDGGPASICEMESRKRHLE